MSKGASQIATMALYVGITVTTISGALTIGAPTLENMQDANSVQDAETLMKTIEATAQEVKAEGEGSTRTIDASLERGDLFYQNRTGALTYELRTNAKVISPQSSKRDGDVVLSSSANVDVYNATVDGDKCYMMENDAVKLCIKDLGSSDSPVSLNTSELITHYEFKDTGNQFDGNMTVKLNNKPGTNYGTGYTEVEEFGEFLGSGEVKARVSSNYGFKYDVIFRLPTGADFLKVDVQNFG